MNSNMESKIIVENDEIKHINYDKLVKKVKSKKLTLINLLEKRVKKYPNDEFLGKIINKNIIYDSNEVIYSKIKKLAGFLSKITLEKELIGLFSNNCSEWIISEYAGYLINCPNVPLYATFQPEVIKIVLEETELKIIIASLEKAKFLVDNILKENKYKIEHIILIEGNPEIEKEIKNFNIKVYYLDEIVKNQNFENIFNSISDRKCIFSDIASICYTSGTTGKPKGVILTHKNFIAQTTALKMPASSEDIPKIKRGESYISYLPLAHVFERMLVTFMIDNNAKIGFYRGNPKLLQEDFEIIKPSFVSAVPRVLNIFQTKIMAKVNESNFIIKWIFNKALNSKLSKVEKGIVNCFFIDHFIFRSIKKKFGGNIKYILAGGASLNPSVKNFLQAVLGCKICVGYGQTEGFAGSVLQPMTCNDPSTIGIPYVSTKVKIISVEDYPENTGHLLLKGPGITDGYYKNLEKTKELFYEDGWLKTGDLVKFIDSKLYIVGRIKEMFKTSYGEYIIPERLENLFTNGHIEDIYITGSMYSDSLVAVAVCSDESVSEMDLRLEMEARSAQLVFDRKINKYEIPIQVKYTRTPFININNGSLLTPSLKKKRALLYNNFKDFIEKYLGPDNK